MNDDDEFFYVMVFIAVLATFLISLYISIKL